MSDPIHKIIHTIVQNAQEALNGSEEVTDTLAAFIIRAIVLDPANNFNITQELSQQDVSRLVSLAVSRITNQDVETQTIKSQVYFDTTYPLQQDFLVKEKQKRVEQCAGLLRDIVQHSTKTIPALESLQRKIVSFILLKSDVGVATDLRVIRETTAALESVFPNSELVPFIGLTRVEKEQQLNGLTNLVTGIRLFNRYLEKGGETIQDYVSLCQTEMTLLLGILKEEVTKTEQAIQILKAILEYATGKKNSEVSEQEFQSYTQSLVFNRQHLIYLDTLTQESLETQSNLNQVTNRYEETLQHLTVTCKSKSAVPVDQVYPLFMTLASCWYTFFDTLFLLSFRNGVVQRLQTYSRQVERPINPILQTLCEEFKTEIEPPVHTAEDIVKNASLLMTELGMVNKNADVVHPGNATQYLQLPVEFGGFCPTTLIKRQGLVIPGNKNVGLVRYKERLYSFSNLKAAVEFFKAPDTYIEEIVEMSKRFPSYVQLLHLYKFFPSVDTLDKAQSYTRQRLLGQLPIVSEAGCQVDTHIQDSNVDKKYKWNEWDLRREALMLVNLKDKRTHSSQTDQSHYRRESETQHYQPKESTTQTRRDGTTFVPRTVHYLAGLRNDGKAKPGHMYGGGRGIHFEIRDLTIDQDGQPVPYGGGAYGQGPQVKPIKKDAAC